jgi:hypothetical protein
MHIDKKFFIIIAITSILIVSIVGMFSFGYYPIAFVNLSPIFKFQYDKNYEFAYKYYSDLKIYNSNSSNIDINEFKNTLKKVVFDGLIDKILVYKKLNSEFKNLDLQKQIKDKILSMKEGQFQDILIKLTQFSSEELGKYFFEEQAKFQILEDVLKKENVNMADWLLLERKNAKVIILTKGFSWKEDGVEIK